MRQKRQEEDAVRRAAEQAAHEEEMAELEVRLAAERLAAVKCEEELRELKEFLSGVTPWGLHVAASAAAGNTTSPTTTTLLASNGAYRSPVLRGASSLAIRTPSQAK